MRVQDLPRYHSLVEVFGELTNWWMAAGSLKRPANVGGGYPLDLQILLSGEEGNILVGEFVQEESDENKMEP